MSYHNYCENGILIIYHFEGLNMYVIDRLYKTVLPSKNVN